MNPSTLLIVEDEAIVAVDLAGKLAALGYQVAGTASRGDEAVRLARELHPDLVLMDIQLAGGTDGVAAADRIRRECDIPVIYLTAHSDRATLHRARLTEPFGYILKPFEERELESHIEMALYKHKAERNLREQREWLRVTLNSIGDAVIATDTAKRITFLNPVAATLTGWSPEEALGQPFASVFQVVDEATGEPIPDLVEGVLRERRTITLGNHTTLLSRDGREIPVEDSAAPILGSAGEVSGAVVVFHDVTEKRRAQEILRRTNRTLLALTNSNQALLHATDEASLMSDVCQIVARDCDRDLVCVGLTEGDAEQTVRPVAQARRDDGAPADLALAIDDTVQGRGPIATAVRTGQPGLCADLRGEAGSAPWQEEALRQGYAACLALPLSDGAKAFGVLAIFSRAPDSFSEDEVRLLAELAGDLAHGIITLRLRQSHRLAEVRQTWLASFPELNPSPVAEFDLEGGVLVYANPAARRLFPDLARRGLEHPWVAGLAGLAEGLGTGGAGYARREIWIHDACYDQILTRPAGGSRVRIYAMDITERMLMAQALETARAEAVNEKNRLQAIMGTLPVGVALVDVSGQSVESNTNFRRVWGDGPAGAPEPGGRAVGKAWWADTGEPVQPDEWASVRASQTGEAVVGQVLEIERVDGTRAFVLHSAAPIRDAEGRITGSASAILDITDRLRVEEALRESQKDLQRAQAVAHTGSWRLDVRRNELRWSDETHRIFGIAPGTPLTYEAFLAAVHPDDRERVDRQWQAALRGATYDVEHRILVGETVKWVRERAELEFDAQGQLRGGFGTAQDITELKRVQEELQAARDELEVRVEERTRDLQTVVANLQREVVARARAEAELRESEERYRTLFAAAPVGIAITDVRGQVYDANPALCGMLGISLDQACESNARTFYGRISDRRRLLGLLRRGDTVREFETRLRHGDGSQILVSLQLNRIQIGDRQLLLSLVSDLSRRRKAERHVKGVAALQELFVTETTCAKFLHSASEMLRDWCGCGCAGLRLLSPDGRLPFAASTGFPSQFVKEEGEMPTDAGACGCVKLLQGQPPAEGALRTTKSGSFFSDQLSDRLGASKVRRVRLAQLPCVKAGYASLAHVPIRYRGRMVGSIHLADRGKGLFTPESIEFLESVAPLLGEALHRFRVEAELRESEERFRSMFEYHHAILLLVEPGTASIVDANEAASRFYGYSRSHLRTMSIKQLAGAGEPEAGRDHPWTTDHPQACLQIVQRLAGGETRTVEVHSSPITVHERTLLFSIIHDITERRHLERLVLDTADRERQRIGRDLHDSLGGGLSGLALVSKALARTLARSSPQEAGMAEEIVRGINEAVGRTRSIARGLCPVGLSSYGFLSGIQELARSAENRFRIRCRVSAPRDVVIREDLVASHLFQIVEEALHNAIRHSKGRRMRIVLTRRRGRLALRVCDDGVGLPPDVERATGMGLRTMRYRAQVIGADLRFLPGAKGGTVVECLLPAESSLPATPAASRAHS